jgi:hypothetical protein
MTSDPFGGFMEDFHLDQQLVRNALVPQNEQPLLQAGHLLPDRSGLLR